jgi:hypothetical protein
LWYPIEREREREREREGEKKLKQCSSLPSLSLSPSPSPPLAGFIIADLAADLYGIKEKAASVSRSKR